MDAATAATMPPITRAASIPRPLPNSRWQRVRRMLAARWLMLALVLVASATADFWNLGGPSLWFDETFSVELSRQPVEVLWRYIWGPEPNMELYYLLLHNWLNLLSALGIQSNEFMLRLPSALCGALAAGVVYQLGARFFGGRMVGLLAAFLYIVNRDQIAAAQQVRAYALEVLLICLAEYVFLEALLISRRPTSSLRTRLTWWGAYVVVASFLPYAHLFGGLVLASQGILLFLLLVLPGDWRSSAWRSLFWAAGSLMVVALAAVPALLASRQGPNNTWVGPVTRGALGDWLRQISNGQGALAWLAVAVIIAGLLASLTRWVSGWQEVSSFAPAGMLALVVWFLVPVGLAYALTQPSLNLHLFDERYLVAVAPAWCLLIAASLNQLRLKTSILATLAALVIALSALVMLQAGTLVLAAVVVVGAVLAILYKRYQQVALGLLLLALAVRGMPSYYALAEQQNYRDPAQWLQQHYQPGDGIFCYPNDTCFIPMSYYFWVYPGPARFDANSPGAFDWATRHYQIYGSLSADSKAYALQHHRIFFVSARLLKDRTGEKAIMAWLAHHFTLAGQFSATVNYVHPLTVTVRLYVRNPAGP